MSNRSSGSRHGSLFFVYLSLPISVSWIWACNRSLLLQFAEIIKITWLKKNRLGFFPKKKIAEMSHENMCIGPAAWTACERPKCWIKLLCNQTCIYKQLSKMFNLLNRNYCTIKKLRINRMFRVADAPVILSPRKQECWGIWCRPLYLKS